MKKKKQTVKGAVKSQCANVVETLEKARRAVEAKPAPKERSHFKAHILETLEGLKVYAQEWHK